MAQKNLTSLLDQVKESNDVKLALEAIVALHTAEREDVEQLQKGQKVYLGDQVSTKKALADSREALDAFNLLTNMPKEWVAFRDCLHTRKKTNSVVLDKKVDPILQFCDREQKRLRPRKIGFGIPHSGKDVLDSRSRLVEFIPNKYREIALDIIKNTPLSVQPKQSGLSKEEDSVYRDVFKTKSEGLKYSDKWKKDKNYTDSFDIFVKSQEKLEKLLNMAIQIRKPELYLKCSNAFNEEERNHIEAKLNDLDSKRLDVDTRSGREQSVDALKCYQFMDQNLSSWADFKLWMPTSSTNGYKKLDYKIDSVLHYCIKEKNGLEVKKQP